MSAVGLTPKMKRCKEFIAIYDEMHGVSPSHQEIADNLGLKSKGEVHRLIHLLMERGHVTQESKKARTVKVIHGICPTCGHGG